MQRARRSLYVCVGLICCSFFACSRHSERLAQAVVPAEPSAAEFLTSVFRSLSHAREAVETIVKASTQSNMVELMTANQNGTIAVRMAANELRPFAASRDTNRAAATKALIDGYGMLERSMAIQLAGYERIDSAQTRADLIGMHRQMSDAKVAYQQGSSLLYESVLLALGSVLVPAVRDTGDYTALDMSKVEKEALLATADSMFGPALQDTDNASGPLMAARLLRAKIAEWPRFAR